MSKGLASWFKIWHPHYRVVLVQLILAGTVAGALVYVQNDLLRLFSDSLESVFSPDETANSSTAPAPQGRGIRDLLSNMVGALPVKGNVLPLLILGLFILARILSAAIEFWKTYAMGRLKVRTRDDMETEILTHLLRKDDAFFSRHSPAEIVNRLGGDLSRVSGRRSNLAVAWWSVILIVSSLMFFFSRDWRLATVALVGCVAGALWTQRMTRPVKEMDSDYLKRDDRTKSRFEDFLRAAPEVQVGRLYSVIRRRFREFQAKRSDTFLRYVRLNAVLTAGNMTSYLLAFVAMIVVLLYRLIMYPDRAQAQSALTLVPVVIWALPSLFQNASRLIFLNLEFQLAHTSMKRLLEYETQEPKPDRLRKDSQAPALAPTQTERATAIGDMTSRAKPLVVEQVTYRYSSPDGTAQGGVGEISTTFTPGRWTAVVGGAGSGKSTLGKLLLGHLRPQSGKILCDRTLLDAASGGDLSSMLSTMPQTPALLDSTILQNLLFGRPSAEDSTACLTQLSQADMEVVEQIGLGEICRLKALDMIPRDPVDYSDISKRIVGIRNRVRECLCEDYGVAVLPYEEGHSDPRHSVLECLIGGRCDCDRSIQILLGRGTAKKLRPLLQKKLGAELIEFARRLLRENARLLAIDSFHVYSQLAPFPLDERIWQLKSSNVSLVERDPLSQKEACALCAIALISAPAELAGNEFSKKWCCPSVRDNHREEIGFLKEPFADASEPFVLERTHPYLNWRENLVFGVVEVPNSRTGRIVDQVILEFVGQQGLKDTFTRLGTEFEIGRLGANLSGGQGQLVALCRALLRRTPVLILDEPTSSLDPASRRRVSELLRVWKQGRIVITVSHDPEMVREVDDIKLMDGGRLAASGTYEELKEGSEVFRRTLRQP